VDADVETRFGAGLKKAHEPLRPSQLAAREGETGQRGGDDTTSEAKRIRDRLRQRGIDQPMTPLRPRLVTGSRAGADIPTGEQDPEHTCTICGAPATGWIQYQDVRRPPWQVTHEWRCAEHMPPASA